MIEMLFCLYDRVAKRHLPPFQQPNNDTCARSLRGAVQSDQHLAKNHQDFDVVFLGTYDLVTGEIVPTHEHFATLTSFVVRVAE